MSSGLVKTTNFNSPLYQARFKSSTEGDIDRPGRVHYHKVPEDSIISWLDENALFQISDSIPGRIGDSGYVIIGEDRSTSVVQQSFRDANRNEKPENIPRERREDRFYFRNITVRTQPPEGKIPRELISTLESADYTEVTD